jgi:hypothetical protein
MDDHMPYLLTTQGQVMGQEGFSNVFVSIADLSDLNLVLLEIVC